MSTPSPSRAVLVAIQTPRVTGEELESSLHELTRLVKTLGYHVVGQVTQKRSSDKFATVLGQGKLAELARWTGGSGTVGASFERPMHKAALQREAVARMERRTQKKANRRKPARPHPVLPNRRRSLSWTVICRRHN